MRGALMLAAGLAAALLGWGAAAQQASMTFFVTSAGPGKGADLGGLEGADRHCQALAPAQARAAAPGGPISAPARPAAPRQSMRATASARPVAERQGRSIAKDVEDLHGARTTSPSRPRSARRARTINGRGDTPNVHDILTGSRPDGRAFAVRADLRQLDRAGRQRRGRPPRPHGPERRRLPVVELLARSRGCSLEALRAPAAPGLLYCFAAN